MGDRRRGPWRASFRHWSLFRARRQRHRRAPARPRGGNLQASQGSERSKGAGRQGDQCRQRRGREGRGRSARAAAAAAGLRRPVARVSSSRPKTRISPSRLAAASSSTAAEPPVRRATAGRATSASARRVSKSKGRMKPWFYKLQYDFANTTVQLWNTNLTNAESAINPNGLVTRTM